MNNTTKLSIKVNVADRYYPLKVDIKDEAKIRNAAKLINDKVRQYQQKYTDKDIQDFLSMASLQFVTKIIEFEEKEDNSFITDTLSELNEQLSEYLHNQ